MTLLAFTLFLIFGAAGTLIKLAYDEWRVRRGARAAG